MRYLVKKIGLGNGFLQDAKCNSGMKKNNFPENTIFYVNQAYLMVEKGEDIVYPDHFILGQVSPVANVPTDIVQQLVRSTTITDYSGINCLLEALLFLV